MRRQARRDLCLLRSPFVFHAPVAQSPERDASNVGDAGESPAGSARGDRRRRRSCHQGVIEFDYADGRDFSAFDGCNRGFLPLILRLKSSLVASVQFFLADKRQVSWNVSPRNAESF